MSHYLLLNSWMGADQEEATEKMAKVFRMSNEEAGPIVDLLANGNPWQFEYQVSDQQAEVAQSYLQDLGFDVETIPAIIKGGAPEPLPEELPSEKPKGGGLKGLLAKLGSLFSRKKKPALAEEPETGMEPDPYMEASLESEPGAESEFSARAEADADRDMDFEAEREFESDDEFRPDDEFREDRK